MSNYNFHERNGRGTTLYSPHKAGLVVEGKVAHVDGTGRAKDLVRVPRDGSVEHDDGHDLTLRLVCVRPARKKNSVTKRLPGTSAQDRKYLHGRRKPEARSSLSDERVIMAPSICAVWCKAFSDFLLSPHINLELDMSVVGDRHAHPKPSRTRSGVRWGTAVSNCGIVSKQANILSFVSAVRETAGRDLH